LSYFPGLGRSQFTNGFTCHEAYENNAQDQAKPQEQRSPVNRPRRDQPVRATKLIPRAKRCSNYSAVAFGQCGQRAITKNSVLRVLTRLIVGAAGSQRKRRLSSLLLIAALHLRGHE
jgi:hypothetical protein